MSFSGFPQETGCTDPNALNFNPIAAINDGSCIYEKTNYYPEIIINKLPEQLDENSGLICFNDGLWTFNDSGGEPEIYKIDLSDGSIIQTIRIINAKNEDWEDISQDSNFIYIGDIGNNSGKRDDLCIYKIPKNKIPSSKDAGVQAEMISFAYTDQHDFRYSPRSHNFDCEAMICYHDSIYLFTKNWNDNKTKLYAIPVLPGDYNIKPVTSFNAEGLITGADIRPDGEEVMLVGNKDFVSFLWVFFDFTGNDFFSGNKRRIDMPEMVVVQNEGIAYQDNDHLFLSCEESSIPPRVFRIETNFWKPLDEVMDYAPEDPEFNVDVLDNPTDNSFVIILKKLPDPRLQVELYNTSWFKLDTRMAKLHYDMKDNAIKMNMDDFEPGLYFLKMISGEKELIKKFTVK